MMDASSADDQDADPTVALIPSSDNETSPPLPPPTVYRQRWYILILFSMLATVQGCIFNTYFTTSSTVKVAYGWTDADLGLITIWGPIGNIIITPFALWLMEKGLRKAAVFSAFLCAFSSGIRCITSVNPWNIILANMFSLLNGVSGQALNGGTTTVSVLWFPVYQRATATGIMILLNMLGISFLIGPNLVRSCRDFYSDVEISMHDCANNSTVVGYLQSDMQRLLLIEFGVAAFLFVAVVVYFPDRPPTAPSRSAGVERTKLKEGIRQLLRNKNFWLLAACFSLSPGIYNGWATTLSVNVGQLGISQVTAGWMAFWGTIGTAFTCFTAGRFVDFMGGRAKPCALVILSIGTVATLCFILINLKILPVTQVGLYACVIVMGGTIQGSTSLLYEMACEAAYPVSEAVASSVLYLLYTFLDVIFFGIFLLPMKDVTWVNYIMFCAALGSVLVMAVSNEKPSRLKLDTQPASSSVNEGIDSAME